MSLRGFRILWHHVERVGKVLDAAAELQLRAVVQRNVPEFLRRERNDLNGHFLMFFLFELPPALNLFGEDQVHDDADDDGDREDDKVGSVSGDDDVDGHLSEALLGDEPVGQEVEDDVGQAQQGELQDEEGPDGNERNHLMGGGREK